MSRYIDTAEQAKLIRQALKRNFPAVTFSVRIQRYSGGSCVNVRWLDGPTSKSVAEIVNLFDGKRFDPMIDLSYSAEHYLLPDGSVQFARTYGHSHYSDEPRPKPEGAETVHFSGSVSTRRELSPQFEAEIVEEIAVAADMRPDEFFRITNGHRHIDNNLRVKVYVDRESGEIRPITNSEEYVSHLVYQAASLRDGKPRKATHASDPSVALEART
jgi:hypothetical protein